MPYFDENGNEVDGLLTEDELNEKIEAERTALTEKYEAEKASALERVGAIEAEKKSLEERIAQAQQSKGDGGGDAEVNLVNLRKKLEDTTSALEEERKANRERFTTIENDRIQQAITAVSGGDEELAKKIRYNYDNVLTGMKAETQEQIRTKVENALKLSTDASGGPDPLSVAIGGGSRGTAAGMRAGDSKARFSDNEVAIGSKLGITDADRAKYGPRLKK